jgi:hypothetical protein
MNDIKQELRQYRNSIYDEDSVLSGNKIDETFKALVEFLVELIYLALHNSGYAVEELRKMDRQYQEHIRRKLIRSLHRDS